MQEVVIRLSDEEDKMDLLVREYDENGSKLVDNLIKKRELDRATIGSNLDGKKAEMMKVYSEAKDFVMDTAKDLKDAPTSRFEKEWHKRQDSIRKNIANGRVVSD